MIPFLGIFNIAYIIAGIVWLSQQDPHFSIVKKPISAIAKNPKHKTKLTVLLSSFALLQCLFAILTVTHLEISSELPICILLVVGSSLLIAAMPYAGNNNKTHGTLVQLAVACIVSAIILLAFSVSHSNALVSSLFIVVSAVSLLSVHVLKNMLKVGFWELPLLLLVISWNSIAIWLAVS